MTQMRIGLVGCGGISHAHAKAAQKSDRMKIVACADIAFSRAQEWASKYEVENAYDSMETMLRSEELDVVILATWPAQHLEQITVACELGAKAILCEKSLALGGDEGDRILRAVKESGTFLMEGLMYRHHPQILKARELIEKGAIGQVTYVRGQFTFPVPSNSEEWRAKKELGGGSMMDQGCYMVNAVSFFADSVAKEVSCRTGFNDSGLDIEHTATIIFENGVMGQIHSGQRSCWREEIQISGSENTIVIPKALATQGESRWVELQTNECFQPLVIERFDFKELDSYHLQLENIYECLFENGTPQVPIEESVQNLHTISALLESGRSGNTVKVL